MKRSRDSGDLLVGVGVGGGGGGGANGRELTVSDSLAYMKGVKDVLGENKYFNGFVSLIRDWSMSQRSDHDLSRVVGRVRELFKGHPDLILGFNIFLPEDFEIEPEDEAKRDQEDTADAIDFVNKIKTHNPRIYTQFLKILNDMHSNPTEESHMDEVCEKVACLFRPRNQDLYEEFATFLPEPSIAERYLDIPSYMILPEPSTKSKYYDKISAEVLNNKCILSVSYTADGRYGKKDDYGEDDMYELDMLVDYLQGATRNAEELLEKHNNDKNLLTGNFFCIEDYFTARSLRCIKQLYAKDGRDGTDVIDALRKDAALVLPVLLGRLKMKLQELETYRLDFIDKFKNRLQSG